MRGLQRDGLGTECRSAPAADRCTMYSPRSFSIIQRSQMMTNITNTLCTIMWKFKRNTLKGVICEEIYEYICIHI